MRCSLLLMLVCLANAASLIDTIATAEGLRLTCYLDSRGIPTIGYGHNVSMEPQWQTCTTMQATYLLCLDLARAQRGAESFPSYGQASPATQAVVTEMVFVLGTHGASKFKLFFSALANNEPKRMAQELLNSKWHGQAKGRVERLALTLAEQH